ncbi:MAG: response regulator [Lachnospiraceae bacterium]|nr:response regulator [Lachnospiraceae bacterium]
MTQSTIGSFIRSLRLEKGLTQLALAEKLHVTDKAVSKWERDLSYPDIRILPQLADILGVTVSDLLRESDGESSNALLKQNMNYSDLRAPLHIILGCADLLETYKDNPVKFKRYLDAIRVSGEYLLSAVNRMHGEDDKSSGALEELLEVNEGRRNSTEPAYDFKGCRILIAEDIKVNQEIAREILKTTNAELEFAENGQICVDMVKEKPGGYYDLILMDIMMPQLNGIEAARQIRSLPDKERASVPIIAMTANAEEQDRVAAFDAGMNAFVEKPFNADILLQQMKEFIAREP